MQDGISYTPQSEDDYTVNVGRGDYSGHVVIPATVTYDGDTWTVAGVVDGAFNHSGITAITWNPRTVLSNSAFGSDMNPNMLVYVQSESYAPTNVQNIVANGRAKKIVLTDAASGNDFNCPVAFTAEEISYTHRYGMTTGIGGGVLRDVFSQTVPAVLKKRIYAVASIAGSLLYCLLRRVGVAESVAAALGILSVVAIRVCSTHYHWDLPVVRKTPEDL